MSTHTRSILGGAVCLLALASAGPAAAATRDVCDDPHSACTYTSIQAAVDASGPGDEVVIAAGFYPETVVIGAGRDGLELRGAQAGTRPDQRVPDVAAQSVIKPPLAGADAVVVHSNNVTLDGVSVTDSGIGVFADGTTSGLRVLSSVFARNGNSIVPDSNGVERDVIRFNHFSASGSGGFADKVAIISGWTAGNLIVADNRIADEGATLLSLFGRRAANVRITGNRAAWRVATLARLDRVRDAVVTGNFAHNPTGPAWWLSDTEDVTLEDNVVAGLEQGIGVQLSGASGPNVGTVIEGNNFDGAGAPAVQVDANGALGEVEVHFNRLARSGGYVTLRNDATETVDARWNWWGCNEGYYDTHCANPGGASVDRVWANHWLVLTATPDRERIIEGDGGETGIVVALRDSSGGPVDTSSFPASSFATTTTAGFMFSGGLLDAGGRRVPLRADASAGADVTVTFDSATVTTHVAFGPEPALTGPAGATGTDGAPGGPGPAGATGPAGPSGAAAQPASASVRTAKPKAKSKSNAARKAKKRRARARRLRAARAAKARQARR